ncbi:MAG: zinc ribbon domain-containing protein [Anaerofustis stercorihominis]|nr:zinc ribbon domain-containing protein [Anaerofustis stercorihominis]
MKEFVETIICRKCGNKLAKGETRCPVCGSKKIKVQLSGFEEPDEATKRLMRAYDMANEYLKTNKKSVKDVTAYLTESGFMYDEAVAAAEKAVDEYRLFDSFTRREFVFGIVCRVGALVIGGIIVWILRSLGNF